MRRELQLIAIASVYAIFSLWRIWPPGYGFSLLEKGYGEIGGVLPEYSSRTAPRDTAIIMYDTRLLDVEGEYVYWKWAAELNFHYANRHNYDFIYNYGVNNINGATGRNTAHEVSLEEDGSNSVYKIRPQCTLHIPGEKPVPRGASWCKLLAVAAAFEQGYPRVVVIDSDAFFKIDAPSLDVILETFSGNISSPSQIAWFANNEPFSQGSVPNAALQIWDNSSPIDTYRLLRQWWQLDVSPREHYYEQGALWKMVEDGAGEEQEQKLQSCLTGVLTLPWMDQMKWKELPLVHIPSDMKQFRQFVFLSELSKLRDELKIEIPLAELNQSIQVLESSKYEALLNMVQYSPIC